MVSNARSIAGVGMALCACVALTALAVAQDAGKAVEDDMRELLLFEFNEEDATGQWVTVNDTVMGGVSSSRAVAKDGVLHFTGDLSLENNGGFCSVRSNTDGWTLPGFEGLKVRIKTGDRPFRLTVRTDRGFDGVMYRHDLPVTGDEWKTVQVRFADFKPTYHGRVLSDRPPIDPSKLRTVGFIIADGREGEFKLEVDSIHAWANE
ncbi:MAG: CIA30 family protein [Armatimonadia bacterium]|nr:CIA30 family protein [Armatimonadia bacterium]